MSVTVTEKAAKEVLRFIEEGEYEEGACLRISVSGGGCSGFNYGLNIAADYDELSSTVLQWLSTRKATCSWTERPLITTKALSSVVFSSTILTPRRLVVAETRSAHRSNQNLIFKTVGSADRFFMRLRSPHDAP